MKLLVDTHYLLWMFIDTSKISGKAKEALLSADNEIYYSQASLWEISIKYSIGKLALNGITIWQAIKNGMVLLSVDSKMDNYVDYGLVMFE